MNTYADGDKIFLFGFSRGAYTARALASVLHVYGLLCAGNDGLIAYVLHEYQKKTKRSNREHSTFPTEDVFRWQFSHTQSVDVHFCGVWDTVSSYGWAYDPITLPFNGQNPILRTGRHAVSIHERRCYYRDNLWGPALQEPKQDIKQVWFAGVHSDVGGSYHESEAGLAKLTLEWMFSEAEKAGLRIDHDKAAIVLGGARPHPAVPDMPRWTQPDPKGPKHQSLRGLWWILEYLPHWYPDDRDHLRIPRGRKRTIPENSLVHQSVIDGDHCPEGLPKHAIEPWVPYPRTKGREIAA
jgi:hypothetical protein